MREVFTVWCWGLGGWCGVWVEVEEGRKCSWCGGGVGVMGWVVGWELWLRRAGCVYGVVLGFGGLVWDVG